MTGKTEGFQSSMEDRTFSIIQFTVSNIPYGHEILFGSNVSDNSILNSVHMGWVRSGLWETPVFWMSLMSRRTFLRMSCPDKSGRSVEHYGVRTDTSLVFPS